MISKMNYSADPRLGDVEFDFTKDNMNIYNTIIFAGENGVGKTTILDKISKLVTANTFENLKYIEYFVEGKKYAMRIEENSNNPRDRFRHYDFETKEWKTMETFSNTEYKSPLMKSCTYSKARSGFVTKEINNVQSLQIDDSKANIDNTDDYTSIKQLFVDLSSQDNDDFVRKCKTNPSITWEEYEPTSKLYRFTSAFNGFFDNLKFKEINTSGRNSRKIIFVKDSKEIEIDSLSTGEQQIVFRGAYLLKNSNIMDDGYILIDEPELSLHPKWQKKIVEFYRNLFVKEGKQIAQIFIASHSEYILESAALDRDNILIINLEYESGIIQANKMINPFVLSFPSIAEINYRIFGVSSVEYHNLLYGELQQLLGILNVKSLDQYIENHFLYDANKYMKSDPTGRNYNTLPTYIRNAIHHPEVTNRSYTEHELNISIDFLVNIIKYNNFE